MFRIIESDDFSPFGKFRLELLPVPNKPQELAEVHLFTGVNGTGKTRLLSVLAAMLGNTLPLARRVKGTTQVSLIRVSLDLLEERAFWGVLSAGSGQANWQTGGSVSGLASQVAAFAYNGTAYVSDSGVSVMAGVKKPQRTDCLSFSRAEGDSQPLLQAIMNLKLQAAMDSLNTAAGAKSTRSGQLVRAIENTLTQLTGYPFYFAPTSMPAPALKVRWGNSELLFDNLPDGLRSIIGWLVDAVVMMDAWLQGQGDVSQTQAVFLLDEIESHLHPVWQRRILPAFQRLFPNAQMFVATHSPFVISSLNHGWIYRLKMNEQGKVEISKPEAASLGDSYIYVLEEIMGLPEWFDPETEKLLADFRSLRDKAFEGNGEAKAKAFELAQSLASRSDELRFMMGKELSQMKRRLGEQ